MRLLGEKKDSVLCETHSWQSVVRRATFQDLAKRALGEDWQPKELPEVPEF